MNPNSTFTASSTRRRIFEELEKITQWFDSEEHLDLDKGLKQFERGLELASLLKEKLSEVENKVVEIKKKFET